MRELARNGALNGVVSFVVTVAVRIIDIAGWLDTWFSGGGTLLNIAVLSRYFGNDDAEFAGVEVTLDRYPVNKDKPVGRISIKAADPSYDVCIVIKRLRSGKFDKNNLLLAVLSLVPWDRIGDHHDLDFRIMSPIPPGASMGTSAAVAVALLKAVNELLKLGPHGMTNDEMAMIAYKAETEVMGGQSGTQDQWAAAFSDGVSKIIVTNYPETQRQVVKLRKKVVKDLEAGLVTVFVGKHGSSGVHQKVISGLEQQGSDSEKLMPLRLLAEKAIECLFDGDLIGFGEVMKENTEAQRGLHLELVGERHQMVIDLANKMQGCLGWKVNGAGGAGGSVTLLFNSRKAAVRFYERALKEFEDQCYLYFEHQLAVAV